MGGDSAQLIVDVRPNDLAGGGHRHRPGRERAPRRRTSRRRSATSTRALEQRSIRLQGPARPAGGFLRARRRRAARTDSSSRSARWPTSTRAPRKPKSAAFYNGTPAIGLDIVKSREYSTTAVADARQGARRRACSDAAGRDAHRDGARRRCARAQLGAQRRRGADRRRAAHGARRLPVPEFVALDGDHRPGAARCRCWRRSSPLLVFGFTLNTMSLLGLSLAIGILIDDAIVVRENIVRHVEMGDDHMHAAHEGHRRDRPRRRGDDVLDRRRVRAGRVHAAASRGSGSSRSR